MTLSGWLQIAIILAAVLLAAVPLGAFMAKVYAGKRTVLSPVLVPVERGFYVLAGVDPAREQGWRSYALAMLLFNAAGFALLYAILRLQGFLPFNPQGFGALSPDLAFNTAVSFVTNTNWQSYGGETTMSHFSQMAGLTVQNFLSAATGLALAMALVRGFARSKASTVGNFWVDMTRSTLYVLLPLSLVTAILLVALGMPQTMLASVDATTLEGAKQTIAVGPAASQVAIKQLGTNGGGFFNANAAHPFENPTALTNFVQVWQMLVISVAVVFAFGRLIGDGRQARALVWVMGILLTTGIAVTYVAEAAGTPILHAAGIDTLAGNMEGKEVRFGLALSALWAAVTTGLSCGAVNAMHASFTPIGGMIPMFLMQLGEILPGGVGSGLYGILVMAIIAVFVAGLMVGRTPEYLGKRIEAKEVKMAMLAVLILPTAILGFSAIAAVIPQGLAGLLNAGPHGLSEILYAYSSAAGNNGSAFAGLTANSPWYNTTLGLAMLLGRFAYIVPMLAIAGSLAAKTKLESSTGTFPTHGPLFIGLLIGVILILGGLQFFPALALGPIAEQVMMLTGKTF
ncbi:potassium-transporting ATPase subunit KdpA [Microvirga mediterraneensis]|uniref:Potassium-transporting ATPase potassium-binding subunit n=1 Tax=Microvirga mediterraneensis TaxID=2754695 RepID=A0A838BTJ0_9HYPH|nr:potassium-transporting ATPase subunit KdpA [Microvirga mediterraneensis]MBA1158369.1 potassium-transporting ATPase subunit KdpA [Microvirga mediterraneensis]